MSAAGTTVRLSPENAANLQRLAALLELDPERILNGFLLDELNEIDDEAFGIARYCAMRFPYSDRQTALRVAERLSRRAWAEGYKGSSPLMVADGEDGGFIVYEREDEQIPTL